MEDKNNANLVIFAELECKNQECGNKNFEIKQYPAPGIPYCDYVHESMRFICPSCGNRYKDEPSFSVNTNFFDNGNGHDKSKSKSQEEEKEQEQDSKSIEQQLTEIYHFKTVKDTEEIYYYNSEKGIFVKNGEQIIKQEYVKYFPDCKIKEVDQVLYHIRWSSLVDRNQFDSKIEWIAANDCMINLKTGEIQPHSPEFMTTVKIPHNYFINIPPLPTPENYIPQLPSLSLSASPCPKIMKFLYEVMSGYVETFLDFVAYCLWREYKFHKWLLLNGSGRNGKGVTTNLVTTFLGKENVSSESLQRLLGRVFSPAQLYGKLANIDADLSKDMLGNTGLLKKITGGDRITVEKKFKNPFDASIVAKMIFSANVIPQTSDESDAFFARLIIINFPKQFLGDAADPHLIDKLTTEQEMSGFFNLIVPRVAKVLEKGITGSNQSLEENYLKYMESSDPIRAFVETAISRSNDKDSFLSKTDLYNAYMDYCIAKQLNPESQFAFSQRLTKDFDIHYELKQKNKSRDYYWIGVKLKDWQKAEEGQETF